MIPGNDGYLLTFVEEGFAFTSGLDSVQYGGAVHWKTPLRGLMFGVSDVKQNLEQGAMTSPYGAATFIAKPRNQPAFFSRYEKDKLMVAFEYSRFEGRYAVQFAGPTTPTSPFDNRGLYAMASYKVTDKLTAGAYHSESVSHVPGNLYLGTGRYSKDWTVSGRYDFNQFLYVKAEEHFIAGTSIGYDTALNPGGLKPNTKLTILKVGVSF